MPKVDREFELKLGMEESVLKQFRDKDILRDIGIGEPETRKLKSIYYDTPDLSLRAAGYSLRIRRVDGKWLQTVKSLSGNGEDDLSRLEIETEIETPIPDLNLVRPGRIRKKVLEALDNVPVEPLFETNVWRTTRLLGTSGGGRTELAVDTGEIRCDRRSEPISEIELELKSGSPRTVFAIADDILKDEPFRVIRQSKAERGYRLCEKTSGPSGQAAKAVPVSLAPDQTARQAFHAIVVSCCGQILRNMDTASRSGDPEGPHQLRIGLRRLRCAVRAHRKMLDRGFADDLDRNARKLARLAGRLRDIDVLIGEFVGPYAAGRNASGEGAAHASGILLDRLVAHRREARRTVREEIASGSFSGLQLDMVSLLEGAYPSRSPGGKGLACWERDVAEAARGNLRRSWRKAAKYGNRIEGLGVSERHDMRKALKNHRYMVEFYSSLFPGQAVRRHVKWLKRLQTNFGYLNDVAMVRKIREIYEAGPDVQGDVLWTIGHIQGLHDARAETAWRAAQKDWKKLGSGKLFWETE